VYGLNGDCLFRFVPVSLGLGIAAVSWSPCGTILAVAGCDGKIRLFNAFNW
jgi:WD40 repeat protein